MEYFTLNESIRLTIDALEEEGWTLSESGREDDDSCNYYLFKDKRNNWITINIFDDTTDWRSSDMITFSPYIDNSLTDVERTLDTYIALSIGETRLFGLLGEYLSRITLEQFDDILERNVENGPSV